MFGAATLTLVAWRYEETVKQKNPQALQPATAWSLGQALRAAVDGDVLLIGSGSLTHNLQELGPADAPPQPHAQAFVEWIRAAVRTGDADALIQALQRAPQARRAHPTAEHFLPLLVAAGAAPQPPGAGWRVRVLDGGMRFGVLSMESYVFGAGLGDAGGAGEARDAGDAGEAGRAR